MLLREVPGLDPIFSDYVWTEEYRIEVTAFLLEFIPESGQ